MGAALSSAAATAGSAPSVRSGLLTERRRRVRASGTRVPCGLHGAHYDPREPRS